MFTLFANVKVQQVDINHILAFLEFLVFNKFSPSAIVNIVSAVKSRLQAYGVSITPWTDTRVSLFTKSLYHCKKFKAHLPRVIDVKMLTDIVKVCDSTSFGFVFKAAYLIAFYSFLRISNLVPHCTKSFSLMHQLARGDVFFATPGLHLLIKWSKTLQKRNKAVIIKVSEIPGSILCPVSAVKELLRLTPGHADSPLFQVKLGAVWTANFASRLASNVCEI